MRLTGKNKNGRYGFFTDHNTLGIFDEGCNADKCYTKLGQLEDIEEELGIDLITLFKALKNGIWIKETIVENGEIKNLLFFYEDINLYKDRLYAFPVDIYNKRVPIYQYGKTWALTKEELL